MSYSLNSLKWAHIGDYIAEYYGVIRGDTGSLEYSYSKYEAQQVEVLRAPATGNPEP